MLLQFSFSNFKSFRDENTLNMEAASIKEHQEHLIEKNKNEKYLKLAAIHGANASGKSNVVEAMKYMRYIIFNSFSKAIEWDSILTKKFKFNEESKKGNSLFEVFFTVEDIEYQYGFEINEKEIFEEWLYEKKIDEKKDSLVFFREKDKIELSKELENYRVILNTVKEKTLLLSFLANLNINNITRRFSINLIHVRYTKLVERSLNSIKFAYEALEVFVDKQ
ncbi:MAG: AAA family ATPase, partial [Fusobacterium sp.]